MCYYTDSSPLGVSKNIAVSSFDAHFLASEHPGGSYPPTSQTEKPSQKEGIFCSCVQTARSICQPQLPKGDAIDLQPNGPPQQNGIVLLNYTNSDNETIGHMACIQAMLPKGMWVQEGNKEECEYTERFVSYDDPAIRGFWHIENGFALSK